MCFRVAEIGTDGKDAARIAMGFVPPHARLRNIVKNAIFSPEIMPLKVFSAQPESGAKKADAGYDQRKISQILHAVNPPERGLPPEEMRITVHAAVTRISVLYEKLRNAVDYREEHLLRKGAIVRILTRQLVLDVDPLNIAQNLIRELIAARYLPNAMLPETAIDEAASVIRKYQAIERAAFGSERHKRWVLGMVATELEELLVDPQRDKALVTFLYERLANVIRVRGVEIEDTDRRLEIYIACYRTLLKADDEQIAYKYLRAYLQDWMVPDAWVDSPEVVAERLVGLEPYIRGQIVSPLTQRFVRAVRPWAVSLLMLTDALDEEKEKGELLTSVEQTRAAVANAAEKRQKRASIKLRRGTVRAMVYLFITKIVFALALEVPIEWYFYASVAMTPLAINIALPPTIMFFVGVFIRRPDSSNRLRIVEYVDTLLSPAGVPPFDIRLPRPRRGVSRGIFGLLYFAMFIVTFGAIGYALWRIHFSFAAIAIFFLFLCLVSFFGYRLRQTAREILVVQPKERLWTSLADFFMLPILRAGRWLSTSISKINVFTFILDILFEAPLKIFLGALEESLKFIKEKKDELTQE